MSRCLHETIRVHSAAVDDVLRPRIDCLRICATEDRGLGKKLADDRRVMRVQTRGGMSSNVSGTWGRKRKGVLYMPLLLCIDIRTHRHEQPGNRPGLRVLLLSKSETSLGPAFTERYRESETASSAFSGVEIGNFCKRFDV